ncbi:MAG: hypothetical protein LBK99_03620, partial [Opitutaceae bacterium]|nr:hypothetical protein [Opitutaceae bacterium]
MKHSLSRPASVFVFSLLVVLLSSPAIAARTLPAWTPPASENANSADPATGLDYRIGEWLFQPGETTATPPSPGDWEIVRVPFLWTSGNSRLVKPAPGEPPLAAWTKKPSEWKNHDNGWFERAITIPAAWAGQRVWLAFDQIECDALLWTGGDAAAAAPILLSGPEARVDITPRIQPGKTTTLRLWVTRWWRDIPRAMDDAPLRREALKTTASNTKGGLDAVRKTLPAGIPGYVTLQVRPAAAEITGIFARPSYREKTLTADVDIAIPGTGKPPAASAPDRATAAAAATALRIRITDPEGRGGALPDAVTVPLTLPAPPPPAPAAETVNTRTVTIPWPAPRLWQLGDGYLYQLRAELLDAAGRVLHAPPPQPFGFREIHVQGREIIMNGRPVRLRLAPVIAPHWPALLFWEGIGFNAAQWHPNGGSWFVRNGQRSLVIDDEDNPGMRRITAEVIEQADRRGFALLMPSPLVSHVRTAIGTPEGAAAYERECRLWFARLRNHPSILMWNPSMNTGSSTRENAERLGMLPEGEDRVPGWAVRANEIIKRVDPTRIVAHHCGPGGEVDLPNQYLNFLPLQERIEFPSHWAEKGDIPWGAIEHGTPWLMNFMKPLDIPQFTEWHAAYFGDRAYAAETDDYVKLSADYIARGKRYPTADTWIRFAQNTLHWEFDTLFTRETNRAWRAWGVPGGWKPWNFDIGYGIPPALAGKPVKGDFFYTQLTEAEARATLAAPPPWANPVYHAWRETMQPLLAYLGGPPERFTAKDHAWRAGEKFRKTVVVVWDGNAPRALRAEWRLETGGRILQSGTLNLALRPGDIVKKPFDLQAPAVSERTDARLTLVISDAASGAGVPPASVAARSGPGFQPVDVAAPPPSPWARAGAGAGRARA